MARSVIQTNEAPKAIGPYSQAIKIEPKAFVYCSGQVGLDPASGELVPGGVEAETRRAMENIRGVLAAAGLTFENVVKTTIFLADINDFAKVNAIYGSFFKAEPPARSTVAVAALPKLARVEIEAIACVS
jgi:2-iminobutanoate/2-iminopropanoate deaminase